MERSIWNQPNLRPERRGEEQSVGSASSEQATMRAPEGQGGVAGFESRAQDIGRQTRDFYLSSGNTPIEEYKEELGKITTMITRSDSKSYGDHFKPLSKITDCHVVASYNWLDREKSTILVPGAPPIWNSPDLPKFIPADIWGYSGELNAERWPNHPIAPAIQAVFDLNNGFNTREIDVVTSSITIGSLLEFVSSGLRDFKIDVEVIGDTVFLLRRDTPHKAMPGDFYGHGNNFLQECTSWSDSVKGSVSNQRIIRYKFGGLQLLVRSECNGYLGNTPHDPYLSAEHHPGETHSVEYTGVGQSMQEVESTSASAAITESAVMDSDTLTIQRAGWKVSQTAIFDVKTRREGQPLEMDNHMQRMWVRQAPILIAAYHRSGVFSGTRIHDMRKNIENWERDNNHDLCRLGKILQTIILSVKCSEAGKLCVHRKGDALQIREQEGFRSALPSDLKSRWAGRVN